MKQRRMRTAGIIALTVVLGLAGVGYFALVRSRGGASGGAEARSQFVGAPGLTPGRIPVWGSPSRDLYKSVDSPRYVGAAEASGYLEDDDGVFTLRMGTSTYVFPQVLMTSYHVVNDVIEGEPVAITYCLLAGSACRLSRRVGGEVLTFGLTGQLYCGNSVLYDKETGTDWLQMDGEPVRGHYYGRARLAAEPLRRSKWGRVKQTKGIKVLAPAGDMKEYRSFQRDMEAEKLGEKVVESQTHLDPRLLPYTKGAGVRVQGEARFYPEQGGSASRLRNDTLGGWSLLVLPDADDGGLHIFRRRVDGRVLDFELREDGIHDLQTHSRWNDEGVCLEGPLAGKSLDRPSYTVSYWFAWAALHPETSLAS